MRDNFFQELRATLDMINSLNEGDAKSLLTIQYFSMLMDLASHHGVSIPVLKDLKNEELKKFKN